MSSAFAKAINDLDEESFQALYGRWDALEPAQVAELFRASSVRWWIAGGRAARIGAPVRHHEDTDVAVRLDDLDELRNHLADWHLWEANSGTLRPLLSGDTLTDGCEQLWARRNAQHVWQLDLVLDRSTAEWVFKRDARIRVPWERALHTVNGIPYLRPEIALLHKAHLDRPKDRADLAAAQLDPSARAWLSDALTQVGNHTWADLVRAGTGQAGAARPGPSS
jgi:aminoglycoside-2''-adenylyltransferase